MIALMALFYADWTTPGGDFDATASAALDVGGVGYYVWSSAGLLTDVEFWRSNPGDNFGWLLMAPEKVPSTAKRFDTRNNPDPLVRPVLYVEYELSVQNVESTWGRTKALTR